MCCVSKLTTNCNVFVGDVEEDIERCLTVAGGPHVVQPILGRALVDRARTQDVQRRRVGGGVLNQTHTTTVRNV